MQDHIEQLVIGVRADTATFSRDVSVMRNELEGPLASSASRSGRQVEEALGRAISGGKSGFTDLRKVAVAALAEIAQASLTGLINGATSGRSQPTLGGSLINLLSGLPGRATGGPVDRGRPYLVGERGPELFVPSSAGRIDTGGQTKNVQVSLTISGQSAGDPQALRQSSRQIARSLRKAILSAR